MKCYNSEWLNRFAFRHRENTETNSDTISNANTSTSNTESITTEIPVSTVTELTTSTTSGDARWFTSSSRFMKKI